MENRRIIQVASISHDHGVSHYAAETEAGLRKIIALDFCLEYPEDAGDQAAFHAALECRDYAAIIHAYFCDNEKEFLDISYDVEVVP